MRPPEDEERDEEQLDHRVVDLFPVFAARPLPNLRRARRVNGRPVAASGPREAAARVLAPPPSGPPQPRLAARRPHSARPSPSGAAASPRRSRTAMHAAASLAASGGLLEVVLPEEGLDVRPGVAERLWSPREPQSPRATGPHARQRDSIVRQRPASARGPRRAEDGWDVMGRTEGESIALAGLDLWIQTAPSATQSTAPHVADVLPRRDRAAYWQRVLDEESLAELDRLADVVLHAASDGPMATLTPRAPPAPDVGRELLRRQRHGRHAEASEEAPAEGETGEAGKEKTPTPTPTPPASPQLQPTVPVVTVEQTKKVDPQEAARRRLRLARKRAKTVAAAGRAFAAAPARRRSPNVSRQSSTDDATAAWAVSASEWAARQATTDVVHELAGGSAPLPMSHVAIAQRERMQTTPGSIPSALGRRQPVDKENAPEEDEPKAKGKGKAKGKSRKRAKGKAKSRKAKRRGGKAAEADFVSPLFSRPTTLTKPIWEPTPVS